MKGSPISTVSISVSRPFLLREKIMWKIQILTGTHRGTRWVDRPYSLLCWYAVQIHGRGLMQNENCTIRYVNCDNDEIRYP